MKTRLNPVKPGQTWGELNKTQRNPLKLGKTRLKPGKPLCLSFSSTYLGNTRFNSEKQLVKIWQNKIKLESNSIKLGKPMKTRLNPVKLGQTWGELNKPR